MIAADAFLATFTLQIVAMSVLYPTWFIRYARGQARRIPPERLAQLYPDVDISLDRERFFTRYRWLNTAIAVLGALLLVWLCSYMRHLDRSNGPLEVLVSVYFAIQLLLPLGLYAWRGVRFNRMRTGPLLGARRTAVLERRRLLDFVSPWTVAFAALSYILFVTFVLYFQRGTFNIGAITAVYMLQAAVVYAVLYGKNPNPLATHAERRGTIGLVVRSCLYSCIACVVFVSINSMLDLLELRSWEPCALSVFFVITALLALMGMSRPRAFISA